MAPAPISEPKEQWTTDFSTLRREHLFRNPPKDQTAYPLLAAAIHPHIHSFNAIFERNGLLDHAVNDIGTKVFLDGDPTTSTSSGPRNRLSVRIREVFLDRSALPATNKVVVSNREVLPAECRERHVTYRGKMRARLEYRVNEGNWHECVRELGLVPIMLRVGLRARFCGDCVGR
jgi:DNA-directed RNA polymerase I subunit RPA2